MVDRLSLRISGMSCANCARRLERVLNRQDGVTAQVDYALERAVISVAGPIGRAEIFSTILKAGFDAEDEQEVRGKAETSRKGQGVAGDLMSLTICAAFFSCVMLTMLIGWHHRALPWLSLTVASAVQFYFARHFYRRAFSALKYGDANMDVLVVLSTSCSYAFSVWNMFWGDRAHLYFETSVFIIFFVSLGKWLEARSKAQAAADLEALLAFKPVVVRVETPKGVFERPVETLVVGDVFIVRPGENIAVDGDVIDGESEIDEALLTGEAHPVYRGIGDKVFAGTTNVNGVLKLCATGIGADTVVARMVETVRNAQLTKAPISRRVDRVTRIFVPVILLIALVTFTFWFARTWDLSASLSPAIAVMVIACPCALGLATPIVMMVAGGRAAREGILMRNAAAFENIGNTDIFVFDKTGTLTRGQFEVTDIVALGEAAERDLLTALLAVENHAEHPLAQAIVNYARSNGIEDSEVNNFRILPGRGVSAQIGGETLLAGAPHYFRSEGWKIPEEQVQSLEIQGKTVIIAARESEILGIIALEDALRPDAETVINMLDRDHVSPILLTGDQPISAKRVAARLGIEDFRAGVLPEAKADIIRSIRKNGRLVAMVGDGINDAPALASADTSIAMGSAAALSMNHADVVLIRNELKAICDFVQLSKAALRKIKANLALAFLYNICAIPIAVLGLLTPSIAAAAMALSSLSVVLNALTLRHWRPRKS